MYERCGLGVCSIDPEALFQDAPTQTKTHRVTVGTLQFTGLHFLPLCSLALPRALSLLCWPWHGVSSQKRLTEGVVLGGEVALSGAAVRADRQACAILVLFWSVWAV